MSRFLLTIHFWQKREFPKFHVFFSIEITAGTVVNYNYEENIASERGGGLGFSFGTVPPIKWNRRVAEGRP